MKNATLTVLSLFTASFAYGSSCTSSSLTTYVNGGAPYNCTEGGGSLTVLFNNNLLPSYVGLNVLSANNSAASEGSINVAPGNLGLEFDSSDFTEQSGLVSSQAELVQFALSSAQPITDTTLDLADPSTGVGLGLGTGLIVGQELICVGGNFTSLPTGLVTSVLSGVLGTNQFGCNGTTLIGTAVDSSGPLSTVTGLLGLPSLTGLGDTADIQLSPYNADYLDIIKLQALVTITGGTASDTGFGNTYSLGSTATPEPGSATLLLGAGVLFAVGALRRKRSRPDTILIGD
jgi:MYXO-CTERM domain-containing protein